jgi:spermidine synthase
MTPGFLSPVTTWLRALARWMPALRPDPARPFVRRTRRYTSLQFNRRDAQSRMLTAQPDLLLVDYTRTMMGALLFVPQPRCIGMVGLGGGSQVKFCHRHLPHSRVEVVEIDPRVIALRGAFQVPDDDERLAVVQGDGAEFVQRQRGRYDVLLVDGYDAAGIAPSLSTQPFYDACRDALTGDGVMAVNLYGDDTSAHVARIRHSFGARMLVVDEPRMRNRVVFGWRGQAAARVPFGPGGMPAWPEGVDPSAGPQLRPVFERVAVALRRQQPTT